MSQTCLWGFDGGRRPSSDTQLSKADFCPYLEHHICELSKTYFKGKQFPSFHTFWLHWMEKIAGVANSSLAKLTNFASEWENLTAWIFKGMSVYIGKPRRSSFSPEMNFWSLFSGNSFQQHAGFCLQELLFVAFSIHLRLLKHLLCQMKSEYWDLKEQYRAIRFSYSVVYEWQVISKVPWSQETNFSGTALPCRCFYVLLTTEPEPWLSMQRAHCKRLGSSLKESNFFSLFKFVVRKLKLVSKDYKEELSHFKFGTKGRLWLSGWIGGPEYSILQI